MVVTKAEGVDEMIAGLRGNRRAEYLEKKRAEWKGNHWADLMVLTMVGYLGMMMVELRGKRRAE